MKKILIVGLGLIGGSYALALKDKDYLIYGSDINSDTISYALNNQMIIDGSTDPEKFIKDMDMIILGLYPSLINDFLKKYKHLFNKNQIITDVCGVKRSFLKSAIKNALPATYISHHPMAGREKIGIENSDKSIFLGANFLICNNFNKEEDLNKIKKLGLDLGFKNIFIMDMDKHDRMIGYTSQLTHAIAVSLVNSDTDIDTKEYIGDSYRDLTRIAKINTKLWKELFLLNKDYLIKEINNFESELDKLKNALLNDDDKTLEEIFKSSTKKRKEMDK
jgi:prephenate dehydrogenase